MVADPQGGWDDWIEPKNISDQTMNLAGMYLSDSPDNPLKWRFGDGMWSRWRPQVTDAGRPEEQEGPIYLHGAGPYWQFAL